MSLSLIGIIWFKYIGLIRHLKNDEQFKFHVTQVMGNVAAKLQKQEAYSFMINTIIIKIVVKFRKRMIY
jgi:two-component system phosphate regulon sensor histidine kinase PhoR